MSSEDISFNALQMILNEQTLKNFQQKKEDKLMGIDLSDDDNMYEYYEGNTYKEFILMPIHESETPIYLYVNSDNLDVLSVLQKTMKNDSNILFTCVDVSAVAVSHAKDLLFRQRGTINIVDLKLTHFQIENELLDKDGNNLYNTTSFYYFIYNKWENILLQNKLNKLRFLSL